MRLRLAASTASMESTASSAARLEEQNRAGLVAGGAHGGFIFSENRAGHNGGEHFQLVLVFDSTW